MTKRLKHKKQQPVAVLPVHKPAYNSCQKALLLFCVLYLITLAGFLITLPVTRFTPFTTPTEYTTLERTTYPEEVASVDCELPDYTILADDPITPFGRSVTISNNQRRPWFFTVTANFTLTNRTTIRVPEQTTELVTENFTLPAATTRTLTLQPSSLAEHYASLYFTVTVLPDDRQYCEQGYDLYIRTKSITQTRTEERTYLVPYTERFSLWRYLILWAQGRV